MLLAAKISIKPQMRLRIDVTRKEPLLNSVTLQKVRKCRPNPLRPEYCTVTDPEVNRLDEGMEQVVKMRFTRV